MLYFHLCHVMLSYFFLRKVYELLEELGIGCNFHRPLRVSFEGETGVDEGGLLNEVWYVDISAVNVHLTTAYRVTSAAMHAFKGRGHYSSIYISNDCSTLNNFIMATVL